MHAVDEIVEESAAGGVNATILLRDAEDEAEGASDGTVADMVPA
jgi:hypothetical protein